MAHKEIDNIKYISFPFRTRDDDDSDIEFDDERNVANPPYPSYARELSEARARQRLEVVERDRAISTWNTSINKNRRRIRYSK